MRALSLLTLTILAATALTAGCAERICNGPNEPGPAIVLNVSPWQHAHHDTTHDTATLRGCVGTTCVPVTGTDAHVDALPAGAPLTLTVTAIRDGVQVLRVSKRIKQVRHSVDGPCGTVVWWQTPVTLTAAGTLAT